MKKCVRVRAEVVVQIEFLEIRLREAPRHFRLLGCAITIGPDELITRRPELRPEIGAICAQQLKQLQNAKRWRSPMFMRFSCMLLKTG